jgi:hypothetical protein
VRAGAFWGCQAELPFWEEGILPYAAACGACPLFVKPIEWCPPLTDGLDTQEFFEKDMGLPLTMTPNYDDFSCQ